MKTLLAALAVMALFAAACGGGGSDSSESEGSAESADPTATVETEGTEEAAEVSTAPPAGLPPECLETPFEMTVDASAIAGLDGPFTVVSAYGKPQPLVPNPDAGGGGDEQSQDEFLETLEESKQLAAETDLLAYSVWLADFAFEEDDIAMFGGPDLQPGGTVLALTIVPTSETGFMTGDTVNAGDEIEYETFTTLAPMGSRLLTDLAREAFLFYSGEPTGSAEILHLDENWICVAWNDEASTSGPDGEVVISGVTLAPLAAREELPLS